MTLTAQFDPFSYAPLCGVNIVETETYIMTDTNQVTIEENANNNNEETGSKTLPDRPKSKTKTQFVNEFVF